MNPRINIYKQIRGFYSKVFSSAYSVQTSHISLYMFLLNQCNRANWVEWFKCPYDIAMLGSCIHSNKTYYQKLNDLQEWGFLEYQPGINMYKAPKIKLVELYESKENTVPTPEEDSSVKITQLITQLTTQLGEQLTTQLLSQLSTQVSTHIYILLNNNYKLVISNKQPSEFPFNLFWQLYDKRVNEEGTEKEWNGLEEGVRREIMEVLPAYIKHTSEDKIFRKDPMNYLINKCWRDEIPSKPVKKGNLIPYEDYIPEEIGLNIDDEQHSPPT